jgi:hypothetical protein
MKRLGRIIFRTLHVLSLTMPALVSVRPPRRGPGAAGLFHDVNAEWTALCLPYSALPSIWLVLRCRRALRRHRLEQIPPGHCPSRGYDLRATPGRCPECGKVPEKSG